MNNPNPTSLLSTEQTTFSRIQRIGGVNYLIQVLDRYHLRVFNLDNEPVSQLLSVDLVTPSATVTCREGMMYNGMVYIACLDKPLTAIPDNYFIVEVNVASPATRRTFTVPQNGAFKLELDTVALRVGRLNGFNGAIMFNRLSLNMPKPLPADIPSTKFVYLVDLDQGITPTRHFFVDLQQMDNVPATLKFSCRFVFDMFFDPSPPANFEFIYIMA